MGAAASKQSINKAARKLAKSGAGASASLPPVAPPPVAQTTPTPDQQPLPPNKPQDIVHDGLDPQHIQRVQQLGSALDSGLIDRLMREARADAPKHPFSPHNDLVSALHNRSAQTELAAKESSPHVAAAAPATARAKMYLHPQTLTAVVRALASSGPEARTVAQDYGLDARAVAKIGTRLEELPREDRPAAASSARSSDPSSLDNNLQELKQLHQPFKQPPPQPSREAPDLNSELGKLLGRAHGADAAEHQEQDELELLRQSRKPRRRQKSAFHVSIEQ